MKQENEKAYIILEQVASAGLSAGNAGEPVARGWEWKKREMGKFAILAELWEFLRVRKKMWLLPLLVFLLLIGLLIIFSESSAVAPFIYTLF